jgi:hypothetical protein
VSDVDSCVLGNVGGRELRGGVLEVKQRVIKCAPILSLLPDILGKARHDARHRFDFLRDVTLSLRGGGGAGRERGERGEGGRRRRGMVKASRSRSEGDVKATRSASEAHILPDFASNVAAATAPCKQEISSLLGIRGEAQVVDAAGAADVAGAIAGFTSGSSPLNQPKESVGGGLAKEKVKEGVKALSTLSDLRERERERERARALTLGPPLQTAAPAPEGLAGGGGRGAGGTGGEEEIEKDGTEAKKEPFRMRPRKCKSPPPQSATPPPSDSLSLSHPAPDHGTETHARQKGKTEEALSVTPPPQEAPQARELLEEVYTENELMNELITETNARQKGKTEEVPLLQPLLQVRERMLTVLRILTYADVC